MAVTRPTSTEPLAGARAAGPRHGGQRPPGRVTDRLFRWVALGERAARARDPRADRRTRPPSNAWPWFETEGLGIFADNWDPAQGQFGAGAMIYGTFLVGLIALVISVPVSIGIALFVTEVAPAPSAPADHLHVDLLAAIPSVVYGLWALARARASRSPTSTRASRRRPASIPVLEDAVRRPEHDRAELHDRRDHRRDHDHADHHVAHPRGVRHHAAAAQGSRLRRSARPLGDDPGRGLPAQPRRRRRRGDDRLRARDRRDDRGRARRSAARSRSARTSSARATRWPASSPTSSASRPAPTRPRSSAWASCCSCSPSVVGMLGPRRSSARYDRRSGAVA